MPHRATLLSGLLVALSLFAYGSVARAATGYQVTSTADDGSPGTLRWAIGQVNASGAGTPTITFNVGGGGAQTITLGSNLPYITHPVLIDGTTQPPGSSSPLITVSGTQVTGSYGLVFELGSDGSNLRGVGITKFDTGILLNRANSVVIGGSGAGQGNLLTGNNTAIAAAIGDGCKVIGNFIGTDATGTIAAPNGSGIGFGGATHLTIGGNTPGAGNLISGNTDAGIFGFYSDSLHISGNLIGTDVSGTLPLPNGYGVLVGIAETDVVIGGTSPGDGNTIAYNLSPGVTLLAGAMYIRQNRIFANGGPGIDNGFNGFTANDSPDVDGYINSPVLLTASTDGSSVSVTGTLDAVASTMYTIEVFASAAGDPSGFGEGEHYVGSTSVSTSATGHGTFSATLPGAVPAGYALSATAISADGTSEFGANVTAVGAPATVRYTGALTAAALSNATTATFSLKALVSDAQTNPVAGHIAGASVNFIDAGTNTVVATAPVVVNSAAPTTGTASATWVVDLSAIPTRTFLLCVQVTGGYARDDPADDALLTASRNTVQSVVVNGAGSFKSLSQGGSSPAIGNSSQQFGVNVYRTSPSTLGGTIALLYSSLQGGTPHAYYLQSSGLTGVSVTTNARQATITGAGSLVDLTNGGAVVASGSLAVTVTDRKGTGADSIAVTLQSGGSTYYLTTTSSTEASITAGDIQVLNR